MILNELVDLLESGGVSVRREALGGGGGGLCKVKGKWIFFLDTEASLQESIACGSEAVARVIENENICLVLCDNIFLVLVYNNLNSLYYKV